MAFALRSPKAALASTTVHMLCYRATDISISSPTLPMRVTRRSSLSPMNAMPAHDSITTTLLRIFAAHLELEEKDFLSDLSFHELGADSMDMVEMQALAEEAIDIRLPTQIPTLVVFKTLDRLVRKALAAKA